MAQTVFDLINPADLVGYVRGLAFEANLYPFVLSQYLPQRDIMDTEFRFDRGYLVDQDAATYRTFDAESPIAGRLTGTRVQGSIPPVSRKIRLGEEERLRLRAIETGSDQPLIAAIYDDLGNMTRSVLARIELARGEALHSGQIVLNENGVSATINFGRSGSHSVTAGTLWSDHTNADPVADLLAWVATYVATNGVYPAYALISSTILNHLLGNAKIRAQASSITGIPASVSVDQLAMIMGAYQLPMLVVNNEQVRVAGAVTRVIPANKLVFLPPDSEPLGHTLFGITAESLDLVKGGYITSEQAPGVVGSVLYEFDPVAHWTKAAALALPLVANPDLTFGAVVA